MIASCNRFFVNVEINVRLHDYLAQYSYTN
jgi:hypothetical protein